MMTRIPSDLVQVRPFGTNGVMLNPQNIARPVKEALFGLSDLARHDNLMAERSSYFSSGDFPQKTPNSQ